jgi:hypothetical protein
MRWMPSRYDCWMSMALPAKMPSLACIFFTLPPDENASPAPVTISTEMSCRAGTSDSTDTISSIMPSSLMALRVAGWLKVSVATRSATSNRTCW